MIGAFLLLSWFGCDTEEVYVIEDTASVDCVSVSYANVGEPFMTQYCIGCHATMSSNRQGAPIDVTLDTLDNVMENIDTIHDEILLEEMPPSGGVTLGNIDLMLQWLNCERGQ